MLTIINVNVCVIVILAVTPLLYTSYNRALRDCGLWR